MTLYEFTHQYDDNLIPLDNALGIDRVDMPQIRSALVSDFIGFLEQSGVQCSKKEIPACLLKPIQNFIGKRKLATVTSTQSFAKPIVVSSDNYILDGHHRWYKASCEDQKLSVWQTSCTMRDLLNMARKYPRVEYQGQE